MWFASVKSAKICDVRYVLHVLSMCVQQDPSTSNLFVRQVRFQPKVWPPGHVLIDIVLFISFQVSSSVGLWAGHQLMCEREQPYTWWNVKGVLSYFMSSDRWALKLKTFSNILAQVRWPVKLSAFDIIEAQNYMPLLVPRLEPCVQLLTISSLLEL